MKNVKTKKQKQQPNLKQDVVAVSVAESQQELEHTRRRQRLRVVVDQGRPRQRRRLVARQPLADDGPLQRARHRALNFRQRRTTAPNERKKDRKTKDREKNEKNHLKFKSEFL